MTCLFQDDPCSEHGSLECKKLCIWFDEPVAEQDDRDLNAKADGMIRLMLGVEKSPLSSYLDEVKVRRT